MEFQKVGVEMSIAEGRRVPSPIEDLNQQSARTKLITCGPKMRGVNEAER